MHCMLCKPQTLVKANTFMDMVKQRPGSITEGCCRCFLPAGFTLSSNQQREARKPCRSFPKYSQAGTAGM